MIAFTITGVEKVGKYFASILLILPRPKKGNSNVLIAQKNRKLNEMEVWYGSNGGHQKEEQYSQLTADMWLQSSASAQILASLGLLISASH